jgi:hypothetical protein
MAIQFGDTRVTTAVTHPPKRVTTAVTPAPIATPAVTTAVTREEFDELRKMVVALKAIVEGFGSQNRAAYMREYRKRSKS